MYPPKGVLWRQFLAVVEWRGSLGRRFWSQLSRRLLNPDAKGTSKELDYCVRGWLEVSLTERGCMQFKRRAPRLAPCVVLRKELICTGAFDAIGISRKGNMGEDMKEDSRGGNAMSTGRTPMHYDVVQGPLPRSAVSIAGCS
eukprot:4112655-Pyramimonas_sp.AAC.1